MQASRIRSKGSPSLPSSHRHSFLGTQFYYNKLCGKIPADIVIIGSGPAGLTLAASLSSKNKVVAVLEQNKNPGGGLHTFDTNKGNYATGLHYIGKTPKDEGWREYFSSCTEGSIQFKLKEELMNTYYAHGCDFPSPDDSLLLRKKTSSWNEEQAVFADNPSAYDFVTVNAGETFIPLNPGAERLKKNLVTRFPDQEVSLNKYFSLLATLADHPQAARFFKFKCLPFKGSTIKSLQRRFCKQFLWYAQRTVLQVLEQDLDIPRHTQLFAILTCQFGNYGSWFDQASFYIHAVTVNHYLEGSLFPVDGPQGIVRKLISCIRKNHLHQQKESISQERHTQQCKDVFCNVQVVGVEYGVKLRASSGLIASTVGRLWRSTKIRYLRWKAFGKKSISKKTLEAKRRWLFWCIEKVFPYISVTHVFVRKDFHQESSSFGTTIEDETPEEREVEENVSPTGKTYNLERLPVGESVVFATSSLVTTDILSSKTSLESLCHCVTTQLGMRHGDEKSFVQIFFQTLWYDKNAREHRKALGRAIVNGGFPRDQSLFGYPKQELRTPISLQDLGFFYAFVTLSEDYPHRITSANVWGYPGHDQQKLKQSYLSSREKGLDCEIVTFFSAKIPATKLGKDRSYNGGDKQCRISFSALVPVPLSWFDDWKHLSPQQRKENSLYTTWKQKFWEKVCNSLTISKFAPDFQDYVVEIVTGTPLSSVTYLGSKDGSCYSIPGTTERFGMGHQNVLPRTGVQNIFLTGQDVVTAGIAGSIYSAQITHHCVMANNSYFF